MKRVLNALFPFVDFLYILQLEEYRIPAYFRWVKTRWWKRGFERVGRIERTAKTSVLFCIALVSYIAVVVAAVLVPLHPLLRLAFVGAATAGIPVFVAWGALCFTPFDWTAKLWLTMRAARKLRRLPGLKVVAIAGSHGKTTTRSFIFQLVGTSFKSHTPEKNINTFVGLARDILRHITSETELYLVELGEFRPGDLAKFCAMLRPSVAVLTPVGSQHRESFGSQEKIDAEFASFLEATRGVKQIVHGEDPGVARVLRRYGRVPERYFRSMLDVYLSNEELPEVLHPPFMQENAAAAIAVAEHLRVPKEAVKEGLRRLVPYERRFDAKEREGILVIDDSYNINPESAASALRYLGAFRGRRKVLVTGGIVEQGDVSEEVNVKYGEMIAAVADVAVLASNIFANYLETGIRKGGRMIQVVYSPHPRETPAILRQRLRAGDVVLIQNELPDLYWH